MAFVLQTLRTMFVLVALGLDITVQQKLLKTPGNARAQPAASDWTRYE